MVLQHNMQVYKFVFKAEIGLFNLGANISSPLTANWKRSNESASTTPVEMLNGKVTFNQILNLPVNMYFEQAKQAFQEKKSLFSFTMNTPKGEKQAGVVYVDLGKMLNDKLQVLDMNFPLQKCPVKDAKVHIKITSECIGEKGDDANSVNTSIISTAEEPRPVSPFIKETKTEASASGEKAKEYKEVKVERFQKTADTAQKDKIIFELNEKIKLLTIEKEDLALEVRRMAQSSPAPTEEVRLLREQLVKSKNIQNKLESEVNRTRYENVEHEKELEKMRVRMEQVYEVLCNNLNTLY